MEFSRNYLFFPDDGLVFDGFFEDSVSAVRALATGEAFPWGVELSDDRVSWWRRNASQIPNTF